MSTAPRWPWWIALAIGALGCGHTRRPIFDAPIEMSAAEADRVDRLVAEGMTHFGYARDLCRFWEEAKKRTPRNEAGASSYIEVMRRDACNRDPSYDYRASVAEREAMIAVATVSYAREGERLDFALGEALEIPVKRGRCYELVLRFPEGFEPKGLLEYEHKQFLRFAGGLVGSSGAPKIRGPGAVMGLGCAFMTQNGVLTVQGSVKEPRVPVSVEVFAKSISEAATASMEAAEAERWRRPEAKARDFAQSTRGGHCQRCADDYVACNEAVAQGTSQMRAGTTCLGGYVECLAEDRGDGRLRPYECVH
jgi:hypothetical protein